jgi:polyhydroxyalkanoate synthesis regulator phasin
MNDESLDEETRAASLKTLFEEHNKDKISPVSSLLKKEGVSYDEAEKFAESLGRNASEAQTVMEEYGFKLNSLTGRYEATATTLQLVRDRIAELEADPDADQEELNKLRAMVDDLEKQEKRKTTAAAFTDVFSNYDKITTESAAALATALGTTYEDVVQTYLIDNGNGTFSLDMSKVQSLLQSGRAIIGDALYNELLDQVAEFYDDGLTAIADAGSFVSKGTDKATDMQKFVTDFNKKTGSDFSISDMFQWDDVLETYTLKPQYLQEYLDA